VIQQYGIQNTTDADSDTLKVLQTKKLIFITRKHHNSWGGMQRMSYALDREFQKDCSYQSIALRKNQYFLPLFLISASLQILFLRLKEGRAEKHLILLGDALLTPLAKFARFLGIKARIGCCLYGLDITYPSKMYQQWLRLGLQGHAIDIFFAISAATKISAEKAGIDPKKISVILPSSDHTRAQLVEPNTAWTLLEKKYGIYRTSGPTILFVGRLVERKGILWFLESVFPLLKDAFPDIFFLIVGQGPLKEEINETILSLQLEKNISVLSNIPDNDLSLCYRAAELFVMPNIPVPGDMEGFGLVALEAAHHERWVVGSRIEGICDAVIEGKTGTLLIPGDQKAYIKTITELFRDKKALYKRGVESREYILSLPSWSEVAEKLISKLAKA
jgi:phosphatidyl-myo-inositol dimannoside synthase